LGKKWVVWSTTARTILDRFSVVRDAHLDHRQFPLFLLDLEIRLLGLPESHLDHPWM
jgi:hypothetical protein